jgi:pimeloyl-ACP methyl ester carboxylesterase
MPGSLAPDKDSYLAVPGARLRYRDTGAGPAVLLIHGWTLDLEMWDAQVEALSESFRVIRLDRRGFGLSSGTPALTDDVADARALCRHLALNRVAVLGMSQGSRVAARLAATEPDLLSCVVLDGAPAGIVAGAGGGDGDVPLTEFRALVRDGGMEAFRRAWTRHPLTQLRTSDPRAHELVARMIGRYRGEDLQQPPAGPPEGWEHPALDSVCKAALVIGGAFDIDTRRDAAEAIARKLPVAERAIVPDAGHLANLDNPQAYNALLLRFLEQHAIGS